MSNIQHKFITNQEKFLSEIIICKAFENLLDVDNPEKCETLRNQSVTFNTLCEFLAHMVDERLKSYLD